MILNKAKEYAENFAQQQIRDSVITVPAFFNQAERRAMLKAAELAGLKGRSLYLWSRRLNPIKDYPIKSEIFFEDLRISEGCKKNQAIFEILLNLEESC